MSHKCDCCLDEFEAEDMCDHFDDLNKHQWCNDCCIEFDEGKAFLLEKDDLD